MLIKYSFKIVIFFKAYGEYISFVFIFFWCAVALAEFDCYERLVSLRHWTC